MCLKIKNILSVLNPFGIKKQYVDFPLPLTWFGAVNVVWAGKALKYSYNIEYPTVPRVDEYSGFYINGDGFSFNINLNVHINRLQDQAIHFNCTNVTYLEVNGQQLI